MKRRRTVDLKLLLRACELRLPRLPPNVNEPRNQIQSDTAVRINSSAAAAAQAEWRGGRRRMAQTVATLSLTSHEPLSNPLPNNATTLPASHSCPSHLCAFSPLQPHHQTMVLSYSDFTAVEWILAISIAGTFIGHGSIALSGGEPKWYTYLQVAAINPTTGRTLMPLIGALDVAVGIAAVVWPHPLILAWAAVWGAATAVMRPLAGETVWAAVERTGNSLPAVALMWMVAEREEKGGAYYYGMVVGVMAMMLAAVTLLLRQTGLLAGTGQPAAKVVNKSK